MSEDGTKSYLVDGRQAKLVQERSPKTPKMWYVSKPDTRAANGVVDAVDVHHASNPEPEGSRDPRKLRKRVQELEELVGKTIEQVEEKETQHAKQVSQLDGEIAQLKNTEREDFATAKKQVKELQEALEAKEKQYTDAKSRVEALAGALDEAENAEATVEEVEVLPEQLIISKLLGVKRNKNLVTLDTMIEFDGEDVHHKITIPTDEWKKATSKKNGKSKK